MSRDLQALGNIAVTEDHEVVLRLLDQSAFVQDLRSNFVTRGETLTLNSLDVKAARLTIADGASFKGNVDMDV